MLDIHTLTYKLLQYYIKKRLKTTYAISSKAFQNCYKAFEYSFIELLQKSSNYFKTIISCYKFLSLNEFKLNYFKHSTSLPNTKFTSLI